MGKKQEKKTAKGRLDKFYWMAKEQGYRSRAAFKLVQLNKKFAFLEKARCAIDLCAAPGGWCQVAAKTMPQGSLIIGVDLVPIKPIPHVITFAEDINSFRCREILRAEMKDWRADVVLHDGAPNVGTAWVQDAYSQNELVLAALKLACEFLAPQGCFVTKVFRSKDYNALLWALHQLFRRVEATKPPSSRNVSAEIFVVCQGFKAPNKIDPRLLDPKHVFKDLEPASIDGSKATGCAAEGNVDSAASDAHVAKAGAEPKDGTTTTTKKPAPPRPAPVAVSEHANANVFEPEKKRRRRDGYDDGVMLLYRSLAARDFVAGTDAVGMLGTYNEITFGGEGDAEIAKHAETDEEVRACCQDLRVLGRKDFRRLLRWRQALREDMGLDAPKPPRAGGVDVRDEVVEVVAEDGTGGSGEGGDDDDEASRQERAVDAEMERVRDEAERRKRKQRRRKNEETRKRVQKLQLNMATPMELGTELEDLELMGATAGEEALFGLRDGPRRGGLDEDEGEGDDGDEARAGSNGVSSGVDDDEALLDSDDEAARKAARLEGELDGLYESYKQRLAERDAKFRARQAREKSRARNDEDEFRGFGALGDDGAGQSGFVDDEDDEDDGGGAGGTTGRDREASVGSSVGGYDVVARRKEMEETFDSDDEEDEAEERREARRRALAAAGAGGRGEKRKRAAAAATDDATAHSSGLLTDLGSGRERRARQSREAAMWFDNPLFAGVEGLDTFGEEDEEDDEDEGDEEGTEDEDVSAEEDEEDETEGQAESDFEVVPAEGDERDGEDGDGEGAADEWHYSDSDQDEAKRRRVEELGLTTAEAVTLAQQLVNRQLTKSQLIDRGFHRHSLFHDGAGGGATGGELPSWFAEDESKHYKVNTPITKEAVEALRAKQRALDARPIKKVAEAKGRKKLRQLRRLEKLRKKAEALNDADDATEREKAQSIGKLMAKAAGGGGSSSAAASKRRMATLVVARGANRGIQGRPKGVKGRYKLVDPRQKKEMRAAKRVAKREGKKTSSSSSGRGAGGKAKSRRIPNGYGGGGP